MKKYIVIKTKDIYNYLSDGTQADLSCILHEISANRVLNGQRSFNDYLVINQDEPYAQEVIEIMKKHGHWEG